MLLLLLLQVVPVLSGSGNPPSSCGSPGQLWLNTTSGERWRCDGSAYASVPYPASSAAWGGITGTLSNQTDLQTVLNAKAAVAYFAVARLTADRTTTSTTLGNVTDLAANIGASETWSCEVYLNGGCRRH